MSSKISLYHYFTGHLGLRGISAILASVWIMVLLGFILLPDAFANFVLIGPNAYLAFDNTLAGTGTSFSPFFGIDFSSGYFHLEDFEDGLLNTPGASSINGLVVGPNGAIIPGFIVDSVDADDGVIDGTATQAHSMKVDQIQNQILTITFDQATLGAFPTHVGIVLTDNQFIPPPMQIAFFDPNGIIIGGDFLLTNNIQNGGTADDRFVGVINDLGVSRIDVIIPGPSSPSLEVEVDHLQYGILEFIPVGGELIPVDNVSLVLAYGLVNSWWMAPVGIGIGVGIYLVKRKIE